MGNRIVNQSKKIENILNNQPEDNLVNKLYGYPVLFFCTFHPRIVSFFFITSVYEKLKLFFFFFTFYF